MVKYFDRVGGDSLILDHYLFVCYFYFYFFAANVGRLVTT